MGGQVFDSELHVLLCHSHQCQRYAAFSLGDPGSCWGDDNVQDLQRRRGSVSQERYDNASEKTRHAPEDTCSRYFSPPEGIRGNKTRQSVISFLVIFFFPAQPRHPSFIPYSQTLAAWQRGVSSEMKRGTLNQQ